METAKQKIKDYAFSLGVDDLGVAAINDLPGTTKLSEILPDGRSLLVMLLKETGSCYTDVPEAAMNGRLDLSSYIRSLSYRMSRFIEKEYQARVISLPYSYPMAMDKSKLPTGLVSMRHAAVAAGLGTLGRHNLFMHPQMGTRVGIFALLTTLPLPPDAPFTEDLCINCEICVNNCPAGALAEPGKTNVMRCMGSSQPTGMGANVAFWSELLSKEHGEQAKMLRSPRYLNLLQTYHMGNQYFCFNCQKSCPVGQ